MMHRPSQSKSAPLSRRQFLGRSAAVAGMLALPAFVPASALGKAGRVAPSNRVVMGYIGLGIQPPESSWGLLARYGAQNFRVCPFQLFIPAACISLTMLSLNLFGDGLRDALDPRVR